MSNNKFSRIVVALALLSFANIEILSVAHAFTSDGNSSKDGGGTSNTNTSQGNPGSVSKKPKRARIAQCLGNAADQLVRDDAECFRRFSGKSQSGRFDDCMLLAQWSYEARRDTCNAM